MIRKPFPLLPLRVESVGLFVFANLEPNAPSLATYFDGLLEIIADSGIPLETLQLGDKLPLAIKAITPHA